VRKRARAGKKSRSKVSQEAMVQLLKSTTAKTPFRITSDEARTLVHDINYYDDDMYLDYSAFERVLVRCRMLMDHSLKTIGCYIVTSAANKLADLNERAEVYDNRQHRKEIYRPIRSVLVDAFGRRDVPNDELTMTALDAGMDVFKASLASEDKVQLRANFGAADSQGDEHVLDYARLEAFLEASVLEAQELGELGHFDRWDYDDDDESEDDDDDASEDDASSPEPEQDEYLSDEAADTAEDMEPARTRPASASASARRQSKRAPRWSEIESDNSRVQSRFQPVAKRYGGRAVPTAPSPNGSMRSF